MIASIRGKSKRAIGQGAKTMNPRLAAPAIAEARCMPKLSLSGGIFGIEIRPGADTLALF
jgi:hypothetical protein